jgi:hypothetical protein
MFNAFIGANWSRKVFPIPMDIDRLRCHSNATGDDVH